MDDMNLGTRDHDLLITLNTKVDQVLLLQTDLVTRVAKTEARLDAMDLYHAAIPLKDYADNSKWVDRVRANIFFIITFGGILLSLVGAFIERLIQVWLKF